MVGSSSAHLGARLTSIMADGSHPRQVGLETVKSCPGKPQNASASFCHWCVRLHRKSERVIKGFSCGWEEATVTKTPECRRKAQQARVTESGLTGLEGKRQGKICTLVDFRHTGDVCPLGSNHPKTLHANAFFNGLLFFNGRTHIMSMCQWLALKAKVLKIELIFINECTSVYFQSCRG